jgi:hypothetical protein
MPTGFSTTNLANPILNHLRGGTSWTAPSGLYVKLHTGDPGASATANAATETTRQQATFGDAASGGAISNTSQIQWTTVAASETYSHVSLWDASTGGNFIWSGALASPVAVTAGGTFTIAIGDLDLTLTSLAS